MYVHFLSLFFFVHTVSEKLSRLLLRGTLFDNSVAAGIGPIKNGEGSKGGRLKSCSLSESTVHINLHCHNPYNVLDHSADVAAA